MIRRLLIILFASLFWTVQTVDAAIDHAPAQSPASHVQLVMAADDSSGATTSKAPIIGCGAGCICYVFHHAVMDDTAELGQPDIHRAGFSPADCAVRPFAIAPPTRPPLA